MRFDGRSSHDVEIIITGPGGPISDAEELSRQRSRYLREPPAATGRTARTLASGIDRGHAHIADEAIALGIDEIVGRA